MNPYSNKVFANYQFKDAESPQELMSPGSSGENAPFPVNKGKPLILLILLAVILCICLLPWPTRIDLTFPGGQINAEGDLIQEETIHLEGWRYSYLFRQDKIKVSLDVPELTLSATNWQKTDFHSYFSDFRYFTQLIYVTEHSDFELSHVCIANDDSWCLVQIGDYIYFGCADPDMDAQAILTECRAIVH